MKTPILAFALAVVISLGLSEVEAHSAPPVIPAGQNCVYTGDTNIYGTYGDEIEVVGMHNVFHEHYCVKGKASKWGSMRVYQSVADTNDELTALHEHAEGSSNRDNPTTICATPSGKYKFMALAQGYMSEIREVNGREAFHWEDWLKRYVDRRPSCTLYN